MKNQLIHKIVDYLQRQPLIRAYVFGSTGREIDLVTEKSLSPHVKLFVDKEKMLIYEIKAG